MRTHRTKFWTLILIILSITAASHADLRAMTTATQNQETSPLFESIVDDIENRPLTGSYAFAAEHIRTNFVVALWKVRDQLPSYARRDFDHTLEKLLRDGNFSLVARDNTELGTLVYGDNLYYLYRRVLQLAGKSWLSDQEKAEQNAMIFDLESALQRYISEAPNQEWQFSNVSEALMASLVRKRVDPWALGYRCEASAEEFREFKDKAIEVLNNSSTYNKPVDGTSEDFYKSIGIDSSFDEMLRGNCRGSIESRQTSQLQMTFDSLKDDHLILGQATSDLSREINARRSEIDHEHREIRRSQSKGFRSIPSLMKFRSRYSSEQLLSMLYGLDLWFSSHLNKVNRQNDGFWQDLEAIFEYQPSLIGIPEADIDSLALKAQIRVGVSTNYLWCALTEVRIDQGESWAMSALEDHVLILNQRTRDFEVVALSQHDSPINVIGNRAMPYTCVTNSGEPGHICDDYQFEDAGRVMSLVSDIAIEQHKLSDTSKDRIQITFNDTDLVFKSCDTHKILSAIAARPLKHKSRITLQGNVIDKWGNPRQLVQSSDVKWSTFADPMWAILNTSDAPCDSKWEHHWSITLKTNEQVKGQSQIDGLITPVGSLQVVSSNLNKSDIIKLAVTSPIIQSRQLRIQLDELLQAETNEPALTQWEQAAAALSQTMNKKYLLTAQALLDDARIAALLRLGDNEQGQLLLEQLIQRIEQEQLPFNLKEYRSVFNNQRSLLATPILQGCIKRSDDIPLFSITSYD